MPSQAESKGSANLDEMPILASAVYILAGDQIRLELPRMGHCISGHWPPSAERSASFLKFDDLRKGASLCYDWSCATLFV
jgi:hypothetical protein